MFWIFAIPGQGALHMLVITRRLGEAIVIDGSIRLTVVCVDRRRVRLGFLAPEGIEIDREEVRRRKQTTLHAPCAAPVPENSPAR